MNQFPPFRGSCGEAEDCGSCGSSFAWQQQDVWLCAALLLVHQPAAAHLLSGSRKPAGGWRWPPRWNRLPVWNGSVTPAHSESSAHSGLCSPSRGAHSQFSWLSTRFPVCPFWITCTTPAFHIWMHLFYMMLNWWWKAAGAITVSSKIQNAVCHVRCRKKPRPRPCARARPPTCGLRGRAFPDWHGGLWWGAGFN